MSLIKQLWLSVAMLMLLAFGISFFVSTHTAKSYLEEQLYLKNIDNAASLALSMNQMPKDETLVELQLSAQFDNGHYQLIRLTSPEGAVIAEKKSSQLDTQAPSWFVNMIDIHVPKGVSTVNDGWNVYGTLELESQTSYAYNTLWQSAVELLIIFALTSLVSGLIGSWILKLITNPLNHVVEQAEALGERRFITHQEPKTREFKQLVRSMNQLSNRVKAMLTSETQRLEQIRQKLQQDKLTDLFNRDAFMGHLKTALTAEDASERGYLLLARITPLADINNQLGHKETDQLLLDIAHTLKNATQQHTHWKAARLNGSDFVLLISDRHEDPSSIALSLQAILDLPNYKALRDIAHLAVAISYYHKGESIAQLMMRADAGLARSAHNHYQIAMTDEQDEQTQQPYYGLSEWRTALAKALEFPQRYIQLGSFNVRNSQGNILHIEKPLRMRLFDQVQTAGNIFPWIARLQWHSNVDLAVMDLALDELQVGKQPICINVSAESLTNSRFREGFVQRVQSLPLEQSKLLWVDIPEQSAYAHLEDFKSFCNTVKPYACKVGLEHAGEHFSRIAELNDLGLDYYKLDQNFIHDIHNNPQNQNFVQGVITVAHAIGLLVIAEGVSTDVEKETLLQLGIDGMTGKGIS